MFKLDSGVQYANNFLPSTLSSYTLFLLHMPGKLESEWTLPTICPCTGQLGITGGKFPRQTGWYHYPPLITKHMGCSLLLAISLCLSDLLTLLPSEKTFHTFSISLNLKYVPSLPHWLHFMVQKNTEIPDKTPPWFLTTRSPLPPVSALVFLSSLYSGVAVCSLKQFIFHSALN